MMVVTDIHPEVWAVARKYYGKLPQKADSIG
jgi:hypothetical protein